MDIHIDLNNIGLFLSIVVFGSAHSWYWFKKGLKRGWDDLAFELGNAGYIDIDDETLEIKRVSDREYKKYKENIEFPDS